MDQGDNLLHFPIYPHNKVWIDIRIIQVNQDFLIYLNIKVFYVDILELQSLLISHVSSASRRMRQLS